MRPTAPGGDSQVRLLGEVVVADSVPLAAVAQPRASAHVTPSMKEGMARRWSRLLNASLGKWIVTGGARMAAMILEVAR